MDRKISYIIPCYNSEKTLVAVINEVQASTSDLHGFSYEIILINDGSTDNTIGIISELAEKNHNIIGINLSKNFGQHAALMAGFNNCSGDLIICMDDDGQTPANEAYKLIEKIDEGYDVVYARYAEKEHSVFRNLGSSINGLMMNIMLDKPKNLVISSFFCARKFVIDEIIKYENPYPYVMGLVLRTTKNVTNVYVQHRKRAAGKSGYTLTKLLGLWFNGFTAFSVKPLRIATLIGFIFAFLGLLYGIYVIIKKIINPIAPIGWSSTMAALMFIGGMLAIIQGMIGEYIGRIYISLNRMPQFVIKNIVKPMIDFNNLPEIIGETVKLRPITVYDTDLIVAWRNNPYVQKNFKFQEPFTKELHENWMQSKVLTGKVVQYIIETADKIPIGSIYFRDIDKQNSWAEFGIFIGEKDKWGKGLGKEATILFTEFGLKTLGLKRIFLRVFEDNETAIRTYTSAGYRITNDPKESVSVNDKPPRQLIFMDIKSAGN